MTILFLSATPDDEESALFTVDLTRLYLRWAARHGYASDVLDMTDTWYGGIVDAVIALDDNDTYAWLEHETGIHRAWRAPELDKATVVRSMEAKVVVVPEEEMALADEDLKLEFYKSSGAGDGGCASPYLAVRITHLPTGIVVNSMGGRSQAQNRDTALRILRARLRSADKPVGEVIRLYDFVRGAVVDRRTGKVFRDIAAVMNGNVDELFGVALPQRSEG